MPFGKLEDKDIHDTTSLIHEEFDRVDKKPISDELNDLRDRVKLEEMGVVEDHGVYFYKVKKGDTIWKIWEKVSSLDKFSYLKESRYIPTKNRSVIGAWNVKDKELQVGILLPIPQEIEKRTIESINFTKSVSQALKILHASKEYKELADLIDANYSHDYLANIIESYITKESEYGKNALYRWENAKHLKAFSYSRLHIIFKQGYDFGDAARKMHITEGQVMTDIDACIAVFFAGLYEKTKGYIRQVKKGNRKKPRTVGKYTFSYVDTFSGGYIGLFSEGNIKNLAWLYNGLTSTGKKYADDWYELYESIKDKEQDSSDKLISSVSKVSVDDQNERKIRMREGYKKNLSGPFLNSQGKRFWKYEVQVGGTGTRILQIFNQALPGVDIDDIRLVNRNNTYQYENSHNFGPGSVYLLEDSKSKLYDQEISSLRKNLPQGYTLQEYTVLPEEDGVYGSAEEVGVKNCAMVEKLYSAAHSYVYNVGSNTFSTYSMSDKVLDNKQNDHLVFVIPPTIALELDQFEIITFPKNIHGESVDYSQSYTLDHYDAGWAYKVDLYPFGFGGNDIDTIKGYFLQSLDNETISSDDIVLVDALGFEVPEYKYDLHEYKEGDVVYFSEKSCKE